MTMHGVLAAVAVAGVFVTGCASGSAEPERTSTDGIACTLLTTEEVESFVGEPVRDGAGSSLGEAVHDTCRWGDADPSAPGHILSLRLSPAGAVERPAPGPADHVYELDHLGEDAFGVQQAGGGVRVVFTGGDRVVDLTYDVVPVSALPDDAIDRLVRLAGRVHARLADAS